MAIQTAVLKSSPGIKRDGTKFEGDNYTDGQWVRWQRGYLVKWEVLKQLKNICKS